MANRPKPAALRLLEGSRSRHAVPDEATAAPGLADPPASVADTPAVLAVWDYASDHLGQMGLAAPADRDTLAAYCHAVVNHAAASAIVRAEGVLIHGLNGGLIRHPALVVQRDSALLMVRLAIEFGLTPAARTRISARASDAVDDENPFAAQS